MKFNPPKSWRFGRMPACRTRRRERGSAVIVVLLVLSTMLIYVSANSQLLWQLNRELKFIEKRQLQKFESPAPISLETTNVIQEPSAGRRSSGK